MIASKLEFGVWPKDSVDCHARRTVKMTKSKQVRNSWLRTTIICRSRFYQIDDFPGIFRFKKTVTAA